MGLRIAMFVLAMLCGAATYRVAFSAADWHTSDEAARAVIADRRASPDVLRDAIYVLMRHQKDTAEAIKVLAREGGPTGAHATNAMRIAQESWR